MTQQHATLLSRAETARAQSPVRGPEPVTVTAGEIGVTWRAAFGEFPMDVEVFEHKGKTYIAVAEDKAVTLLDDTGGLVRKLTTDDDVKVIHYWKERGWLVAGCHDFKVIPFDPVNGQRIACLDRGDGDVQLMPFRQFGSYGIDRICNTVPPKRIFLSVGPFMPRPGASTCQKTIGGGYVFLDAVDLNGDGREEVVGLANGLLNGLHVWDNQGAVLGDAAFGDGWASPMPTYKKEIDVFNMRGLSLADLDGNGRKEICVITSRGFLIVLTDRCEKVWARRLPSDPFCVQAVEAEEDTKGCVLVGCSDDAVYRINATGAFTGPSSVEGIPVRMARLGGAEVVVATSKGNITAYKSSNGLSAPAELRSSTRSRKM
jgi:hypothetical protein